MERDRAVTELERNNRTAKAGHLINIVVVIALILLETWTGKRSMVSFMIVVVIGVLPVIAEQFFWLTMRHRRSSIWLRLDMHFSTRLCCLRHPIS